MEQEIESKERISSLEEIANEMRPIFDERLRQFLAGTKHYPDDTGWVVKFGKLRKLRDLVDGLDGK